MKPRLLDLFCGAGGAGMGYHRAGFEVVGVDINPQPRYPFKFHQADALTFPLDDFDVIHASPPCQDYSRAMKGLVRVGHYPRLIDPIRERLRENGRPYVIENVLGATLPSAFVLCGMNFGLPMHRHRMFETWPGWTLAAPCTVDQTLTRNGLSMSPYKTANREAWGVGKGNGGAGKLMAELMEVP